MDRQPLSFDSHPQLVFVCTHASTNKCKSSGLDTLAHVQHLQLQTNARSCRRTRAAALRSLVTCLLRSLKLLLSLHVINASAAAACMRAPDAMQALKRAGRVGLNTCMQVCLCIHCATGEQRDRSASRSLRAPLCASMAISEQERRSRTGTRATCKQQRSGVALAAACCQ